MFTRILRSPDALEGAGKAMGEGPSTPSTGSGQAGSGQGTHATPAADAPLPLRGKDGVTADLRLREYAYIGAGPLTDNMARHMLGDVCQFLRQLVAITTEVVTTIGIGQVRKIVGPELAIPRGVINEDGVKLDKAIPPEPELDRDHRKGPRGAKHPLTVLIQLAVQASKLLHKIAGGTNPLALDIEPLADRMDRMAAANESRETAAMWRGQ